MLLKNTALSTFIGLFLVIAGIVIRSLTIGLEYIKRGGLKRKIYAEKLVTGGIYGICRNPMYLGNLFILAGFGIYANSALFTFIIFPTYIFIYWAIIKAEENFLTEKFGDKFIHYKNRVHPLIPDLSKFGSLFENRKFKWRKVLFKEYNSFFLYIFGLSALALYLNRMSLMYFTIFIIISLSVYFFIKVIKYKNKNAWSE
jgi:protein-S-isoprenylcysteine O-methyltransferase Ste14